MTRAIASLVGLSLLLPLAPATAQPSLAAPAESVPADEKIVPAKMDPVAPMSVSVLQEEPARAGGLGQVRVPVMRRDDKSPQLRNVTTRIELPKGGKITKAGAKGWRCKVTKGTAVCTTPSIAKGSNPNPIYATFQVRKSWQKRSVRVTAQSRWKGGPTRTTKKMPWLVSNAGRVSVSQPLRMKLTSSLGSKVALATNGKRSHRQFMLLATIRNVDGAQVSGTWKQIAGPKATMLQQRKVLNVQKHLSQTVQIPDSRRKKGKYRFQLRLEGNGQVVKRTVSLKAHVHRLAQKSQGRRAALTTLAKASNKRTKTVAHTVRTNNRVRLVVKKPRVLPGKSTEVRVKTKRKVAGISWTVNGQSAGTGSSIRVKAPTVPQRSTLVAAQLNLRNGKVLHESALVTAKTPPQERGDEPTAANAKTVCDLADQAGKGVGPMKVELDGDVTLQFDSANLTVPKDFYDKDKVCKAKGDLVIEKGLLTHPSATFTNVSAKMNATDGLVLDKVSWKLPEKLVSGDINKITLAAGSTPATAPLQDGEWQLLDGELKMAPIVDAKVGELYGLPWIPLADGWKFSADSAVMSFLNSSEDDPDIKDGTLQFSEQVEGPDDMTIALHADAFENNWDSLAVEASNIPLGETANGNTLMAAGKGTLGFGDQASSVKLNISCAGDTAPDEWCDLFTGLSVKDFSLVLSKKVIGLSGTAGIPYGEEAQRYEFSIVGAYTSRKDWSLAVKSNNIWPLGDTLSLIDMAGNISMTPTKDDPKTSQLLAGFTGTLQGLDISDQFKVKELTTSITNRCPPDTKECKTGEIRFIVAAKVETKLPAPKGTAPKTVTLTASSLLNLKNYAFEFSFGMEDVSIGPDELNINKAQFVLTNDPGGICAEHQKEPKSASGGYQVTLRAEATLLESTVNVNGVFDANGYCLWGSPGTMDVGDGMEAKEGVLSYTDFPNGADLTLPREPTQIITANQVRVHGQFDLPAAIDETFGIPEGELAFEATFDYQQKGVTFALTYEPTKPVVMYQGDQSHLDLTDVGFAVQYSTAAKTGSLTVDAGADMVIPAQLAPDTPDRTPVDTVTPMGVSLDFKFKKDPKTGTEIETTLTAFINNKTGPVYNAFGQPDLTIRTLAVSVGFVLPEIAPSLSFAGDVTLPTAWVGNIGIQKDTPIKLSFELSKEKPCLKIVIGEEDVAKRKLAVDIANKGFLTADYFKLVIAPLGCQIPINATETENIEPGYGFEFDGKIIGAPVNVVINAGIEKSLKIKGRITVPSIDLYAVQLQASPENPDKGVVLDLNIDSAANLYNVAFDAGIRLGVPEKGIGAMVQVKGALDTSNENYVSLQLDGSADAKLAVLSVSVKPMKVHLQIAKPGKDATKYNRADVDVKLQARVFGFAMVAEGQLLYEQGHLIDFRIAAGQTLDIAIAKVAGHAEFDYCLGELSNLGQDGSRCVTHFKNVDTATPAYRVGFYGSFRFLWWDKPYTWTAYDQKGAEGIAPPDPILEPENVPGAIPTLIPPIARPDVLRNDGNDLHWNYAGGDVYMKSMYPYAIGNNKACPKAELGSQWTPTKDDPNPDATNVDPYDSAAPCGLVVDMTMSAKPEGLTKTVRNPVVCTQASCIAQDGPFKGMTLAADGPNGQETHRGRSALIAGLRTPLGVLPGGGFFGRPPSDSVHEKLNSPDKKFSLIPGPNYYQLVNFDPVKVPDDPSKPNGPGKMEPTQPWVSDDQPGGKATRWRLSNDGRLQGLNGAGEVLWSVGTAVTGDITDKNSLFIAVQGGMMVWQNQAGGPAKRIWGVDSLGRCVPAGAKCEGRSYQ